MSIQSTDVGPGQLVTSFVSWMATLPGNVGTSGNTYVCNIVGKITDINQQLTGHSCTATNYITIQAKPGLSFADSPGRLAYNAAAGSAWESRNDHSPMFSIFDNYTVVSRMQFYSTGQTQRCVFVNAFNCWVDRCIITSQQRNGLGVLLLYGGGTTNHVVSNTLCVSRTGGANGIEITSGSTAINCTVVRPADIGTGGGGQGVNLNYGTNTIRNCAIFGFFDNAITPTPNADGHNVTDLVNCPGTIGNITGAVYANQFENNTDNGADFRLKPGSDCINAGVTDSTNLPSAADIFGVSRPYGAAWDVGANEWKKAPLIAKIGTGGTAAGRDYSSISAWIASLPANLVTDGNSYRGELYNDGEFNDSRMTIGGHTTDATHTITLTTAAGQSFRDHASKATNRISYNQAVGVGIRSDNGHATMFALLDNYVTFSNIQAWTIGATAAAVQLNGSYSIAENMIIQGTVRDNRYAFVAVGDGNSTSVVRNTIVISMRDYAFGYGAAIGFASGSFANFVNCTAVKTFENTYAATGANGNGFQTGYQPSLVRNCMSFGFIGNYSQLTPPPDGHNCTDVSFIHGTVGNLVNQVYADQFVNPSQLPPEAMDFRLKSTSTSLNAGVDASSVTLQGSNVVTMTTDGMGNTRPTNGLWEIGFEESPFAGAPPPLPWFDRHVDAGYMRPPRRIYTIRRVVAPPPQAAVVSGVKTFWVLNTTATGPSWYGVLQEGGTAPSAGTTVYGWKVGNANSGNYWRARLGSTTTASAANGTSSFIDAQTGPQAGNGSGGAAAGDSFRSPTVYNGIFAAGNWTFSWGLRGLVSQTCNGQIRTRVWASTNPSGAGARALTAATQVGSNITSSNTVTNTSSVVWAAPSITLSNEYLFFELEWQGVGVGNNINSGVQFYLSAASVTTTLFSIPIIGTANLFPAPNTISAAGTVTAGPVTGTLSLNQDPQTISATGTVTQPAVTLYLVSSFTPGGDRNDYTGAVGFVFYPEHTETYNKIGVRKGTGNTGNHTVGFYIWHDDPVPLEVLRTATIDLTSGSVGQFYYADIAPITIDITNTYCLLTDVVSGDGQFWADHGPTTITNYGAYIQYAALGPGGPSAGHGVAGSDEQFAGLDLAFVSGTGPAPITGTLTANQAVQTINANGTLTVNATLTANQAVQTIGANGALTANGTLTANQAVQTISANGAVTVNATLTANQAVQTIGATGTVSPLGVTGNLSRSQAAQTILGWATSPYALVTSFVTSFNDFSGVAGEVGVKFKPASNMDFNRIGLRARSGATGLLTLKLYNFDTKVVLQTASLNMAGTTWEQFYYTSMPTTTLVGGTNYAVTVGVIATDPFLTNCAVTLRNVVAGQTIGTYYDGTWHTAFADTQYYGVDLDYVTPAGITGNLTANQAVQTIIASGTVIAAGAGPPVTTGLNVWLDASQLVLTDGATVAAWPNLGSGSAPTLLAGTPSLTFKANAANGHGVVRFGAGGAYVRGATSIDHDFTIVYLTRRWGLTYGRSFMAPNPPVNITIGFHGVGMDACYDNGWRTMGTPWGDASTLPNPWRLYSYDGSSPTNVTRFFVFGALTGTPAAGEGFQNTYGISGYEATNPTETMDCDVAELLIYDHKLTDVERISVENYLLSKWFAPVTANLTANQAVQTISATGGPTVNGTLTANQAVQIIGANGGPVITGNLTRLQTASTISANGVLTVGANLTQSQATQTISAGGVSTVRGNLAANQAVQTISANGSVVTGISGNLTRSQDPQTISATGTVTQAVTGALSRSQDPQTISASGGPTARGTLTANQAVQTIVANGGPVAGGDLTALQAVQTISAGGKLAISGSMIAFQGVQALLSSGGVTVRGTLAASQMPSVIYGIGRVGAEQTRVILMA